jgi:penicillin-binding protein 1B
MARDGAVDVETSRSEQTLPLSIASSEGSSNELAPYYVDAVSRAMDRVQNGLEPQTEQAFRVETTIDPDLQRAAENALNHQLGLLDKSARQTARPQGAMVVLDPHTGQVLAMVGGRNYAASQLNRATDAKRQPGSVFKPFVYAAAFEAGISPLAIYRDAPQTFQYDNATYSPTNYGKAYSMHDVLLREGLVHSLNVVTVDLAMRTGLSKVAATAARFGLPKPDAYPAMALGTSEATPLQVAAAYSAFANGGTVFEPTVIAKVVNNGTGERIDNARSSGEQVIKPGTAYMITDILSDVIKRGTARRAKASFKNVVIAGKTGTSRDGWFVGYTPNLTCAVWVGFDDNQQLGLTGAEAALPAWIEFMQEALAIRPSLGGASFPKPSGIVSVKIDPESGQLAGPHCPTSMTVNVPYRFAPLTECLMHMPAPEVDDSESDLGTSPYRYASKTESDSSGVTASEPAETPAKTDGLDGEVPVDPQLRKGATQTELNERGQPRLAADPTLLNDTRKLKARAGPP